MCHLKAKRYLGVSNQVFVDLHFKDKYNWCLELPYCGR